MKENAWKIILIVFLFLITFVIIFPWTKYGVNVFPDKMSNLKEYKLWLDLHGWVELDYKIDLDDAKKKTGYNENSVTEGLKSIVEKRVNSLGTAEPTIITAKYWQEAHIIVQIPSQNFDWEKLTETQKAEKNNEFIQTAKETIGKVVRLEFKEMKTEITDTDKKERKDIANKIKAELASISDFKTIWVKFRDSYENIIFNSWVTTKENMPKEATFTWMENVKTPYISDVFESSQEWTIMLWTDGKPTLWESEKWYSIVKINSINKVEKEKEVTIGTWTSATKKKEKYTETTYNYEYIFVDQKPSQWTAAKTQAGDVLDEKYLVRANYGVSQVWQPQIELTFNTKWAEIFKELTWKLVWKNLAIFVWWQLITAPTVNQEIPNGKAIISGSYTRDEAVKQANDINTWIVPAPIYLTSERAIDAKIWWDSLLVIMRAWLIGFLFILTFLVFIYRLSWLFAWIALLIYIMITMAIVKVSWVVLSLASIAWLILSVWLAIDANILIFERSKEELRKKVNIWKAIHIWFDRSWTAIWDSHITQFLSAVILYLVWVNLIKWFWLMLWIGIVVSLFTAMWVSRVLIMTFAPKFENNLKTFIGIKNK